MRNGDMGEMTFSSGARIGKGIPIGVGGQPRYEGKNKGLGSRPLEPM